MSSQYIYSDMGTDFAHLAPTLDTSVPTSFFMHISSLAQGSARGIPSRIFLRFQDNSAMKRGLLLSRPGDTVYFSLDSASPRDVEANINYVNGIYDRAGIEVGKLEGIKGKLARHLARQSEQSAIATTIFDLPMHNLFQNAELLAAVQVLNNKMACMDHLKAWGIDVPDYLNLDAPLGKEEYSRAMENFSSPFFVKKSQGQGGFGVWQKDALSYREYRRKRRLFGPLQIQEHVPGDDSYNMQYLILPHEIRPILLTRQRLTKGWRHAGNDWPAHRENMADADQMAQCCRDLGFVGLLGFDLKNQILEVNPRFNSSSVMPAILSKISGIEKLSTSLGHQKNKERLSELGLDDLWFQGKGGILPTSWTDRRGSLNLAIINDFDGSIETRVNELCPADS